MIKEIKVLKRDWTTRCGEIKQMCKNPEFSAGCVYTVGNPRGQMIQLRVKPLGFSNQAPLGDLERGTEILRILINSICKMVPVIMGKNCQPQRLRVKITWGSLCEVLPLGSGSEKMNEILPFVSRSLRPPPVSVTLWEDSQDSRYSHTHQLSSVTQLCPTLGDPMDCNTPDFPVYHQLPELAQTHVH